MSKHRRAEVRRPTRTALQGGVGYAVAELLDTFVNLTDYQVGLLALILTVFFSWIQVLVENAIGVGFMRDVPAARKMETLEDHGAE